jgi:hypothetical protein
MTLIKSKMNNRVFQHSLTILRKYISENMVVGTGGFTGSSSPEGPVAGFDPPIRLDRRTKVMKKLPKEYFKFLKKTEND